MGKNRTRGSHSQDLTFTDTTSGLLFDGRSAYTVIVASGACSTVIDQLGMKTSVQSGVFGSVSNKGDTGDGLSNFIHFQLGVPP